MIYQEWGWRKRVAAIGVAVMVLAERSRAQVWQVGVGDWLNAGNWSGGLPSYYSGGLIFINNGGTAQVTTGAAGASILEVGESEYPPLPAQSGVVTISGGTLSTGSERLGGSGGGTITQSGGTNTIPYPDVEAPQGPASSLLVGYTGPGFYNLSGGTLAMGPGTNTSSTIGEYIGYGGTGTFVQTGGTNSLGNQGSIYLGALSSSTGNYTLSGGSLLVSGNAGNTPASEYVGDVGTGTFLQTNGINSITGPADNLYLGDSNQAIGTYTLAGGTLTVAGVSPVGNYSTEYVGYSGQGEFIQTGGTNNAGALILGATNADGIYLLSGGLLSAASSQINGTIGDESIAVSGQATFIQSGGTNTAVSAYIGENSGSNGGYTLSGGVFSGLYMYLATKNGSTGTFTQTGGTFSFSNLTIDTSGGTATFAGGSTFAGVTNSGLLAITAPIGSNTFDVFEGNLTQNSGGELLIGIGGDPSTNEFGTLSVNAARLAGTLNVSFINGFTPTVGETFNFLTASNLLTGQFANVISNYPVKVNYFGNNVTITVIPEPSAIGLLAIGMGLLARRRSRQNPSQ